MMPSRRRLASAAALSVALLVSGCGEDTPAQSGGSGGGGETEEVVLGVIDDISGPAAAIGTLGKKSHELAVEAINKSGVLEGRELKLVFYDNKGDPAETAQLTTRLIDQDGADVISCCASSSAAAAAAAVAGQRSIPMLTSTVVQNLTEKSQPWYGYLFRAIPPNDALAQANVDYVEEQGFKDVALSVSSLSYGTESVPYFEKSLGKAGADIVAQVTLDPTVTDAAIQAAQLLESNPDVILTWDYPGPTAQLVKAVRAAGSDVPIVSNWSAINETMYSIAGKDVENLVAHDDAVPGKPAIEDYQEQWQEAFDEEAPVTNFGIYGYNIVEIVAAALGNADTADAEGILDGLKKIDCLKTILGTEDACITFGEDDYEGALEEGVVVYKTLENGEWPLVDS
jgi:branched-chain amino acid transport system substrate-binding protein